MNTDHLYGSILANVELIDGKLVRRTSLIAKLCRLARILCHRRLERPTVRRALQLYSAR
jgi:hypothetical protein